MDPGKSQKEAKRVENKEETLAPHLRSSLGTREVAYPMESSKDQNNNNKNSSCLRPVGSASY